jgi:1,6-anhydro-N-acetylmuramate kinase
VSAVFETSIEQLIQDAADGYALSAGGRERIKAHEQNEEAKADALRARQRAARLDEAKAAKAYVAERNKTAEDIDALNAQLDKTFEARKQLEAAQAEAIRAGNPRGEIERPEPGHVYLTRREGGMDVRDALLVLMSKIRMVW